MKKIWFIAYKDFIYTLKDKIVLLWLFIMPLVFFAFIGSTTQGFGGGSGTKSTLGVWYEGDLQDPVFQQIKYRLEAEDYILRVFSTEQPLYKDKWTFDNYSRQLWLPNDLKNQMAAGNPLAVKYLIDDEGMGADFHQFKFNKAIYQILGDLLILKKVQAKDWQQLDFTVANDIPRMIKLDIEEEL